MADASSASGDGPRTATEMPPAKIATAISIDPIRASALSTALSSVLARIDAASSSSSSSSWQNQPTPGSSPPRRRRVPRLVAVSKLKPASDILALHQTPPQAASTTPAPPRQIHFGENYVQELIEKSRLLPRSIKWHMIGGLQSNKCRELARQVRNLWAVESVDSVKKAGLLEKGRAELVLSLSSSLSSLTLTLSLSPERQGEQEKEKEEEEVAVEKLRIFVQVNTSGEASKAGVEPESAELIKLCRYVREQCPHLQLQGLMTIGAIARSQAAGAAREEGEAGGDNEDFECLKRARERVVRELGLEEDEEEEKLELSMGMSEDFEAAIAQGSDEVRIGTTIFGVRPPKGEAKIT